MLTANNASAAAGQNSISEQDMANVQKLREMVKDQLTPYYDTDFNLLRWLQGHHNNFAEIVPKLKNHLVLRRSQLQLDTLADGPRTHPVHKHWEAGLTGESGLVPNCLVDIEQTGTNDYWGMLHTFSVTEILRARIYDLEVMLRMVMDKEKQTGRQHSIMYVMDLSGLKYDRHLLTLLRGALTSISGFMSEHYVELIHSFVLINAPNFISTIWSIVKPLLPERTRNKVQILGHSSWRQEILTMARPEVLPSFWNAESGEKVFLADVKRSVPVDPSEYYKPTAPPPGEEPTLLVVGAGRAKTVEIEAEAGQTLRWKYETDGHLTFGLYCSVLGSTGSNQQPDYHDSTTDGQLMVYPRINNIPGPTFVPIEDKLVCPFSGTYKFWFSNEHAWIHSLKIRYRISKE